MSENFGLLKWRYETAKARFAQIHQIQIQYRLDLATRGNGHSKAEAEAVELFAWIDKRIVELIKALPVVENDSKYDPNAPKWQRKLDARFDIWLKTNLLGDSYFEKRHVDFEALFRDWDELIGKMDAYIALFVTEDGKDGKLTSLAKMFAGKRQKAEREADRKRREVYLTAAIKVLKESIGKILSADPGSIKGESKSLLLTHASAWQAKWKGWYEGLDLSVINSGVRDALKKGFDEMTASKEEIAKFLPREKEIAQIEYWLEKITAPEADPDHHLNTETIHDLSEELKEIHTILFAEVPDYWVNGDPKIEKALARIENFLERQYGKFAETVGSVIEGVNWGYFPGYENDPETGPFMYESEDHSIQTKFWKREKSGVAPVTEGRKMLASAPDQGGRKSTTKIFK
jgi:hypothetical protein